jgi:phosphoribosylanthranilate isomerase
VVEVKFCGITRPGDAITAAEIGARYAGMIFARSPRRVTPQQGREVVSALIGTDVATVGVFDDVAADELLATAEELGLDAVQLHGWSEPEQIGRLRERFNGEVWAVHRVGPDGLDARVRHLFDVADGVLLDTRSANALGGSGAVFDWRAAAAGLTSVRGQCRVIVAGGLRPENVSGAIKALFPDVVDVSSGVEASPGVKDPQLMRAFMVAVRACGTH